MYLISVIVSPEVKNHTLHLNKSMRFTEWNTLDLVFINHFIFEAVNFKGNVSRDRLATLQHLEDHLHKSAVNGVVSNQLILDKIRHQFTDYDVQWRNLDAQKRNLETCAYISKWNELVKSASERVAQFISNYLTQQQQITLHAINQQWVQTHLKTVPAQCAEDDEDPRQWRSGYRRQPVLRSS